MSFVEEAPYCGSYMSDELSKLSLKLQTQLGPVESVVTLCRRTRGRCELQQIPLSAHPAAALLNNMRTEGAFVHLYVA